MENMYNQWAEAFRSIGHWHISLDKCAKILAIVYDNGGNESFTHASRFVTDWKTAQKRLYIYGEEIPKEHLQEVAKGRELLKKYIKELEDTYETNRPLKETLPQWAIDIYNEYELPIIG